jgi:methylmalonyl-CoA mutase C-terminal domain/subunit
MKKIKVIIAMLGLDQHEVGAIAISRLLREHGIEVVYMGRFNTPAGIVKASIEEDVDLVGLSCHSWEYLYCMPELMDLLKVKGLDVPVVVGGSIITPGDTKEMKALGVAAAFGPSSTEDEVIEGILRLVTAGN